MEIRKLPNISFEHPRRSAFRKYRSRTLLAPVRFTNPNSNHCAEETLIDLDTAAEVLSDKAVTETCN